MDQLLKETVPQVIVIIAALTWVLGVAPTGVAQTGMPTTVPAAATSLVLRGLDGRDHPVSASERAGLRRIDTTVIAAPFHLIIPGEKRSARWVRQVVRIEVRNAP